jgi:hypothetical protein
MPDFCTADLVYLENLLFFIKALGKKLPRIKGSKNAVAHCKVTGSIYLVMDRSFCGLIWPLLRYKVSPIEYTIAFWRTFHYEGKISPG